MKKNKVFDNDKEIKLLKREINKAFFLLAELLYKNYRYEYFVKLDYATFESYIAQEELDLFKNQVAKLISVYETFILKLEADPETVRNIDYNKLSILLPLISRGEITKTNVSDWLYTALSTSYADLRVLIRDEI